MVRRQKQGSRGEVESLLAPGVFQQALAEAKTFGQLKDLLTDVAAVRQVLRRRKHSIIDLNEVFRWRIDVAQKAGAKLAGVVRRGGDPKGHRVTLESLEVASKDSQRWQFLAEVPVRFIDRMLREANQNGDYLTEAAVRRAWIRERDSREAGDTPPLDGEYRTIVIDPPWIMQKIDREVRPKQDVFEYPTMSEEQLAAMELPSADAAHIYCWTTHKHLPTAFRLLAAWDFKYECVLTWVKNVGMTPFSWMRTTEFVLFGRRGGLDLKKKGLPLHFHAKVRGHSRKPDEFYELIKQASPGPRIDIFAREKRRGFVAWGDEVSV